MRLLALFLSLIFISCKDTSQVSLSTHKKPANEQQDNSKADNETLWQRIVARPDSVPVTVSINDSVNVFLVISGKLLSDSEITVYTPKLILATFSNGIKQELPVKSLGLVKSESGFFPLILTDDLNFDGLHDLRIFDNAGATGNFWYYTWLYDKRKGFVFSKLFSEICAPKIDVTAKQILSYYRAGGCEETVCYNDVSSGKPKPVKYVFNQRENCNSDSGCICITYKEELMDGKWKVTKLGEWGSELYDSIYAPNK
jgi:hypothetical protein